MSLWRISLSQTIESFIARNERTWGTQKTKNAVLTHTSADNLVDRYIA